jgi:hypothetical protein
MNLYGFASGDPVNFSDPMGLCPPCYPGMIGMPPLPSGNPWKGLAILAGIAAAGAAAVALPAVAAELALGAAASAGPAVPALAGGKGIDMLRQAVGYLGQMQASTRVDAFRNFAQQIESSTQGQWAAAEQQAVNGTVFAGKAGEAMVFNSAGQMFRGNIGNAEQFTSTAKGLVANFDKLKQVVP